MKRARKSVWFTNSWRSLHAPWVSQDRWIIVHSDVSLQEIRPKKMTGAPNVNYHSHENWTISPDHWKLNNTDDCQNFVLSLGVRKSQDLLSNYNREMTTSIWPMEYPSFHLLNSILLESFLISTTPEVECLTHLTQFSEASRGQRHFYDSMSPPPISSSLFSSFFSPIFQYN